MTDEGSDDTLPADRLAGADSRVGTTVGKYVVTRLLGRGGMGAVYEARHTVLSRRVALKFLLPQFAEHPELLKRFEIEAKAAGRLEHPNVAAVLDFGRAADAAPYLVMEFLEGEDCAQLLERYGRLPPERAVDIVQQACRGLSVAHRAGIVHRDLKPENLFIARGGDGGDWVKVLDFGIAKLRVMDGGVPTRTGATLGTAYYMSPEQARGATDVDERTDVWSLGVVLYQLLSGQRPFQGAQFLHVVHQILSTDPVPLSTLQPELPQALLDVVAHAMAKEVAFRVGSAEALELALAPFSGRTTRRSDPPRARDQRARTQIARATSVGGVTIGDTGIGPRRDVGASAPVRKARTGKMLVLAGLGAAAAGATVAFIHSRSPRPSELSEVSSASLPAASPGAERKPPPPSALIAATAGPSVSTAPTSAAPVPRAAERGDQEPAPRPTVAVRTSSEHAARSSNTGAPSASPSVPVSAPARPAPAPATPEPNTSRDSTEKRAIEIEKGNPYE